jgi:histidinol-phosphatase
MAQLNDFLDAAREAALAASMPILRYYHGQVEVETKDDQTPVTIADKEAEQCIRDILQRAFPDHGIYGEEYGAEREDADYLWLIDPIDGTKSFIQGYGMFSTQIALMHRGRIIVGVSSAPAMAELAWAAEGAGAWLDGQRLSVSRTADAAGASISTGNLGSLAASDRWPMLGELLAGAGRTRGYGDFYHYHRLAAGQIDAVIESDVNILDIAALSLIVTEAGGVFTDLEGGAVGLETRSVLAANPALHGLLLARFAAGADQ